MTLLTFTTPLTPAREISARLREHATTAPAADVIDAQAQTIRDLCDAIDVFERYVTENPSHVCTYVFRKRFEGRRLLDLRDEARTAFAPE